MLHTTDVRQTAQEIAYLADRFKLHVVWVVISFVMDGKGSAFIVRLSIVGFMLIYPLEQC